MDTVEFKKLLLKETLDTITPKQWRDMDHPQRNAFQNRWRVRGVVSHVCLRCGYPTVYGQSSCESCR